MPIARTPRRYLLRRLVWLTALGPPLLALAGWSLIPVWRHFDVSLHNLALTLFYPGSLVGLALIGISIFYYPVALSARIRPALWQVILLWCIEFATSWHWLAFMSVLLGWLFVGGDRHEPPMELIYPFTALFAATISSLTSMRLVKDQATIGYLTMVVSLTAILIVFAAPYWLARLLR
jgi:hypothetical protein